jgi:tRNA 2-thiouridine synthesizing protein C
MKHYLFVLRKPAHSGIYLQETLDIILTTAAFDQKVGVLLLDDGVFYLKKGQHPEKSNMKDTATIFKALALYDVDDIYTERESLLDRGLNDADLCLSVQVIDRKDIANLMTQFNVIIPG